MTKQTAKLNYLRITPRKVRAVADLIRGLSVNEAEAQLLAIRRRPAVNLLKLLRSAVADLKNNKKMEPEKFYVETIQVDQGPMLKRSLPRARGMATPIQKKMSHVTLVLAENLKLASPRFKIVVPKKIKLPPGEDKSRNREKKPQEKEVAGTKPKKPGFFKKIFNRKAGFAK
ncbi:MAG: 50S ribosomal protein L22 [Patescibacteria group bacterium]|nr:50S ribosomal protein L22 [Patescibacteria group bacterium]MDE2015559.1 50S ribosomal protein L22 [Patescibacteria group bacterium]MDE2227245.1 50S ribosomal protein L22 [Patescibacteria group bacterium]